MSGYFMRFPDGKAKALTLSYDDGVEQDIRLLDVMKEYGLKATFNINSGLYVSEDYVYPKGALHRRMSAEKTVSVYGNSGMEVAVHALTHPHLEQIPTTKCIMEVLKDRANLEQQFDCIVRGMAYPYGTYDDQVIKILKQCGIVYARTVEATHGFELPKDWLRMPATCHHNDPALMELAQTFVTQPCDKNPQWFYLWGHSYEFELDDNWYVIEQFAKYIGKREEIWYATNIEVYDYVKAYEQLQFSADGTKIYNPTAITLYFEHNGEICLVHPGEMIHDKQIES